MASQTGQQTITIHIFPGISRSKGNLTMKSGQIIKHNMRNKYFEKLCTNCGKATSPRPFFKNRTLYVFGSTV